MTRQVDHGSGRHLLPFLLLHPTVRFSDVLFATQNTNSGDICAGSTAHASGDAMSSIRRSHGAHSYGAMSPVGICIYLTENNLCRSPTCGKTRGHDCRHEALASIGLVGQIERIRQIVRQTCLLRRFSGRKPAAVAGLECSQVSRPAVRSAELVRQAAGNAVQLLTVLEVDPQGTDALSLLREAAVETRAIYPEYFVHDAPWPTNGPNPVGGVYLVAYKGTSPVGSGAFRPLEQGVAEIRRMFVTRAARRTGVARQLLGELEARAHAFGYTTLRLETGYKQAPAIKLYESAGFGRIDAFGPYVGDPTSVCFQKVIRHENGDA